MEPLARPAEPLETPKRFSICETSSRVFRCRRVRDPVRGEKDTWLDDVVDALEAYGGQADVSRIYKEVRRLRQARRVSRPPELEGTIRRTLQDYCSTCGKHVGKKFTAKYDIFRRVEGRGRGWWRLNFPGLDRYKEDRRVPTLDELLEL